MIRQGCENTMSKKDKRFIIAEKESSLMNNVQVIVDKKTGVNYMWVTQGYAGGLTPLLDRDGKPIITTVTDFEQEK